MQHDQWTQLPSENSSTSYRENVRSPWTLPLIKLSSKVKPGQAIFKSSNIYKRKYISWCHKIEKSLEGFRHGKNKVIFYWGIKVRQKTIWGKAPSLVTKDGNILGISKLYVRGYPLSHWIVLSMRIWSKPIVWLWLDISI